MSIDVTSERPGTPAILLVEDDHGDAVLVQAALSEGGFPDDAVTWRRTFADALDVIETARPDCVLLDLGLPDADGFAAVRKMVEAAPQVAVVVLTGRDEQYGVEALAAGAQDYLNKDTLLGGELLRRSVRYAVERKRAQLAQQQLRDLQLGAEERARLERGLLPSPRLHTGAVECATYYRPGNDDAVLGGDFFDVVEVRPGVVRAVIGDVMGHGADEAALGVNLRVAWRSLVLAGISDTDVLPLMAALLGTEDGWYARFATVCDITLDGETMTMRVAGHPPPILVGPTGASYLDVVPGVPLGVTAANFVPSWPETSAVVPAGSSIVLYTDGLLDAFTGDVRGGSIGVDELIHAVRTGAAGPARPHNDWISALVHGALRAPVDDTAAVVLRRG
ncbi:PP2C family protein-serine/threonine phosphatase [Jatrophihabitans fulvus]